MNLSQLGAEALGIPLTRKAKESQSCWTRNATVRMRRGEFFTVGIDQFQDPTNQGMILKTSNSSCTTTSEGCFDNQSGKYVPILINETKLLSSAYSNVLKS